ncbi:MAG TPA: cytochrome c [Chromatiales bacterium]|nr:cytochrome c [Chromatiales bacterium]
MRCPDLSDHFRLSLFTSEAWAEFDRGRTLYENHCQFCHETWAHKRKSRLIGSLDSLRAWVTSWSVHAGLNWGEEEINDVTRYLNRRFYRLTD